MENNINSISRLINEFSKLPGVGKRTATRYVYKIIEMTEKDVDAFVNAIKEVKENVRYCKVCGAFTDKEVCELCKTRDNKVICVVKDAKDIAIFEKTNTFKGAYHVLGGTISPLKGVGVDELRIKELLSRLECAEEIILALSADVEGDATSMFLKKIIKPLGIKVTRLAHGIPIGQDIEFADEVTLSRAMQERKEV